jgi:hypothetical protein
MFKSLYCSLSEEKTPAGDIYKLTPEEIANDPATKRIHGILQKVGKTKTDAGKIGQFIFPIRFNFLARDELDKLQIAMAQQALFAILPKMFMKSFLTKHKI